MHVGNSCSNFTVYSSFRLLAKLQNNVLLAFRQSVRWSIQLAGFDNMIVAGSCFTLVSEQQGAINIPQILLH